MSKEGKLLAPKTARSPFIHAPPDQFGTVKSQRPVAPGLPPDHVLSAACTSVLAMAKTIPRARTDPH
jgi:hypothetical protein